MKTPVKYIDAQQKEALIVMVAIRFIEEYGLLRQEDLEDAKKSLQALFLRTSGQAALLAKLIEVLRATRNIQQTFAGVFNVLSGINKGVAAVDSKITLLRENLDQYKITAEEHRDFVDPFLSFSQRFQQRLAGFARDIGVYVALKENEAKLARIYRIARDARNQLRDRLKGDLGRKPLGETETRIKDELVTSFDYGGARENLQLAVAEARTKEEEVLAAIEEIRKMCQMAMNPTMRESAFQIFKTANVKAAHEDVFTRFAEALQKHPELARLKQPVVELFKLYQHSYGMLALDWNRLQQGLQLMMQNTLAYFEAKEEDKDIHAKREKLRRVEGLIPFLERGAKMLDIKEYNTYVIYTRKLSDVISEDKSPWASIAEELLRAKVLAEAEMSTKL
jgi:hypothetical protein